jgi:hypothetical protein
VLLTILKNGEASTLSVVNTVKSLLPRRRAAGHKDYAAVRPIGIRLGRHQRVIAHV